MHAIVHASIDGLLDVVREPAEPAGDARRRGACQAEGRHRITEKGFEHCGSSRAIDAMSARVFRVHRRRNERFPSRIAFGGVIAVYVAVADRRHRSPEVVRVFGVKTCGYLCAGLGTGRCCDQFLPAALYSEPIGCWNPGMAVRKKDREDRDHRI